MNHRTINWLFRKPIPATLCDVIYRYGTIMREKQKSMAIPTLLGIGIDETPLIVDLEKIGAILIGGATNSGKSSFLQSLTWVIGKWNTEVTIEFLDCKNDASQATHLDIINTHRGIIAALEHINYLCSTIEERLQSCELATKSAQVCVIDDFDMLLYYNPQIIYKLHYITSKGPAAKVYTMIASAEMTQNNFTDTLKYNCPMHISLGQNSESESCLILDNDLATNLTNCGDMIISYGNKITFAQGFIPEIELELAKDLYVDNDKYCWR